MKTEGFELLSFSEPHSEVQKDRTYWDVYLKKYLSDSFIDNFTDFSDSTCFTYFIPCDRTAFRVGSKELIEYLHDGNTVCYLKFQISLRAPIACAVFLTYDSSPTSMKMTEEPLDHFQEEILSTVSLFAKEQGLRLRKYSDLVDTMSELSPKESVYSYLFEPDIE